MMPSVRVVRNWLIAGAVAGFSAVLIVAVYAVIAEVYVRCDTERCHDLHYAISMVLLPLLTLGAAASLVGGLAALALGMLFFSLRRQAR